MLSQKGLAAMLLCGLGGMSMSTDKLLIRNYGLSPITRYRHVNEPIPLRSRKNKCSVKQGKRAAIKRRNVLRNKVW